MSLCEVRYLGVSPVDPSSAHCLALWWAEQTRLLPIWLAPETAASLAERPLREDSLRPDALLALIGLLEERDDALTSVSITSQFQGTFYAQLDFASGAHIEVRPSDALAVHMHTHVPIFVAEDLLAENSVFMPVDEVDRIFDFMVHDESGSFNSGSFTLTQDASALREAAAGEDAEASESDDEFAEFMRQLGVTDSDLAGDDPDHE